jgi:hypothetical protein
MVEPAARIERGEIREQPINAQILAPGFAAAQPGVTALFDD